MKKRIALALLFSLTLLLLAGCGKTDKTVPADSSTQSAQATENAQIAAAQETALPVIAESTAEATAAPVYNDLTTMNANMVYSYIFSMLNTPDSYFGQTFRMQGQYNEMYDENTKTTYHFVIIADAAACCAQGMEFILEDTTAAYPAVGAEIEVVGTYQTYEENGNPFCYISASSMQEVTL